METKNLNLHEKILRIANMAGVLQKTKSGYSYRYVPEEDIQAKVTAGLQKYGVMLYTSVVPGSMKVTPVTYEKYDAKIKGNKPVNEVIVSGDMVYRWVNAENPAEVAETAWGFVGQMEDAAQAMGAGLTYANRYYLMKQLQLATTESDPDNYRGKQKAAEQYEEDAAAEALRKKIQTIVKEGTVLIEKGILDKTAMRNLVAGFNGGNGNPSGIESDEVCEAILAEFRKIRTEASKIKGE